ncbi:hypothetical protein Pmani_001449 [Petrolisthes manimaculis]|uniref:Glycosyltransferase family 92 protein n=1 Tax=Petrolisthes manimaculis TaxID=1843537 RepID=A0AAE1UKA4_9EUCA|nr:hypothetical protein Pmani_001449 [Petrolisthes manimaculis]
MFTGVAVQDLAAKGTTTTTKPGNLSVCVKPFHHKYNQAIWLVEFIEYYRLQGATMFTFYNHTLGQDVSSVLRYYENLGLVSNAFFYVYWENDTRAVHDTLFPDRHGLGYTLYGDESLMPYLLTAYKTRRKNNLLRHGKRSKYLSRPEKVIEVGNHVAGQTIEPEECSDPSQINNGSLHSHVIKRVRFCSA